MKSGCQASIIIPTYNRAHSLVETLRAIASQTFDARCFELVVVDDGSTDDTQQRVAEFALVHPWLSLHYEKHAANQSKAAACNTGIKAAKGELVVFTDDDIRPVPGWLDAHVRRHINEERIVSVTGLVLYPDEWERKSNWIRYANSNYRKTESLASAGMMILPVSRFAGGNISLRRESLIAAGMFDGSFARGEDTDLGCRLHQMGVPLLFEQRALVHHFAESARSIDSTLRSFRRYFEVDRKKIRERYPWFHEEYGHWYLEPICERDDLTRMLTKSFIRVAARHSLEFVLVRLLRTVDRVPSLYCEPLYHLVMACEAVDAIRASEKHEAGMPIVARTEIATRH